MEKTKVEITIKSQKFSVTTSDSPEELEAFGKDIDRRVTGIMTKNPRINMTQALVLVALDLENELKVQEQATEGYRSRIGDYLQDAESAKIERDKYKRELDRLKKDKGMK